MSYLTEVTALLQRARNEHPTEGLWEAADRQWWWRTPRSTDVQPMPFWYDDHGPVAAAVVNDWTEATWLDLIMLPSVKDSLISEVFDRGRALTADLPAVEMLVDDADKPLIEMLTDAGFRQEPADFTAWMDASSPPEITPLAAGYTLHSRADYAPSVHHFVARSSPEVEQRLVQTSLYRPDLDLFVVDEKGDVAGYGLFWNDPVTSVGLVEPMRTEDAHQRKGIARHILTTGVRKLFDAGSVRAKISYSVDNPAAAAVYLGVGFVPAMSCSLWSATTD